MKMKKILAVLLAGMLCTSLVACTNPSDGSSSGNQDSDQGWTPSTPEEPPIVETEFNFLKDSKSEYALLLPQNATESELLCASEINHFLAEAAGVTLPIVYEGTGVNVTKFLSIGRTEKLASSGVSVNYDELGSSGYVVKTVGDDVYMTGNEFGVVYSAYEFLDKEFNYEYYTDTVYKIDKGVKDKKLVEFNAKEIPAFDYRLPSYGFEQYSNKDSMVQYRMRLNDTPIAGNWHNFFKLIPKETYEEDHPNWYSLDGTQLCLTRDLDGLANALKDKVIELIEANPDSKYVHIGQEDTRTWCTCDTCKATIQKYGGYEVSTYMLMMNKVASLLEPYQKANGTNVKLTMFAYHRTQSAPVEMDPATGNYKLVSEDLKLHKDVYVLYAPIEADYYEPFTGQANVNTLKDFTGWSLLSDQLLLWTYTEYFAFYMYPQDNFNSMQQNFQLARDLGVCWYFQQSQWNNYNSSGFGHLKAYLASKFQWNPDYDIRKLTKDFCENYYGDAAPIMMEILDEYKTWRAYCFYELGLKGTLRAYPNEAIYWPYGLMRSWLNKFNQALASIEHYKNVDDAKYKRYRDAITLDSLSFRYIMIEFWNSEYNEMELLEMKKSFKKDASMLNLTLWKEDTVSGAMPNLYREWGIE